MKVAIIIKHPGRDWDWRIDIVEVPHGTPYDDIRTIIEREMLGPFQIVAITERIDFERKIDLKTIDPQNHRK